MKSRIILLASLLVAAVSLNAKQYPDSVRQASAEEPNIAYGWNFEFSGGAGVGSYTYRQLFAPAPAAERHVTNQIHLPAWNAAFGLSYYFVPWMGLGTGVQFSAYTNTAAVTKPWVTPILKDPFGDEYVLTSTPRDLSEHQEIYMLEVPIALKFRYRPGVVGLTATAGMKIGLPMMNRYQLSNNGVIDNSVYYKKYDLTIHDVPTVVEDLAIPTAGGSLPSNRFNLINYAAYAELGMLIRVHQRVELILAAYANYYINDVMSSHSTTNLAFADSRTVGEYPLAYTESYDGVLNTNEVETLHPWSAGLKFGFQINANRTKSQRDYDREQRRLRKLAKEQEKALLDSLAEAAAAQAAALALIVPVDTVEPEPVDTLPTVEETIIEELTAEPELDTTEVGDPIERAILLIMEIAEKNGINLCEDICVPIPVFVHDTIYINGPAPETAKAAPKKHKRKLAAIIYFHLDKYDPILQPKNVLVPIAEELRQHPEQRVNINGYACKLGKPGYNKLLAMRRAKAVAAELKKMGVRDEQMVITSRGATDSYRNKKEHPLSKDRKVEVFWVE